MNNGEAEMVTNTNPQDLRSRTSEFALRIIRLYSSLPNSMEAQVLGKQVLRSGTSIGAHYREGHRAKSDADIVNKFETALQELDETDYWLNLLVQANIVHADEMTPHIEGDQRTDRHIHDHRDQNQEAIDVQEKMILKEQEKRTFCNNNLIDFSFILPLSSFGDQPCLTNYSNSKKKNSPPN